MANAIHDVDRSVARLTLAWLLRATAHACVFTGAKAFQGAVLWRACVY
eukprot:COSAG02_NODE_1712_length_11221_cov_93.698346_6_plen_48_part_00